MNDLEFLRTWLFKAATIGGNEYVRRSLSERFDEIGEFFVKSWAYSWDLPELQSAIEESEEESILSFKRSVGRELAEMDKRMAVGSQKDNLIGNMINVIPPKTFVKVEYDSVLDEYLEQNKHDFPPFAKLSFNEMITLNDTSVLERFKTLNGKETILHIDELEDTHQNSLNYLLNQLVGRMFEKIGARCVDDSNIYYFPLQNPLTPMKILGAKNKPVMVAKPLLVKGDSSEDAWPLDLGYIKPREKEINFGFHKGFRVSTIKLWDRYFVSLNLRKVYSKDGRKLMEGERSKKIDRYFRNSKYSHGDSFKSVILALFYQLKKTRDEGKFGYFSQMEFKDVLSLETSMSPVTFGLSQSTLELEFEDEMEDGDES